MTDKKTRHDEMDHDGAPRRTRNGPSCDMNVTPLIDVLLVLLIIFMATLPLTQKGVDINLPLEVKSPQQPRDSQAHVVAEYTADRTLNVNKVPLSMADLPAYLRKLFDGRTEKTLFVIGAPTVTYGEMMSIIDAGVGAGAKVAIVTEGMAQEGAAGR